MNPLWLILIVPMSAWVGYAIALCHVGKQERR